MLKIGKCHKMFIILKHSKIQKDLPKKQIFLLFKPQFHSSLLAIMSL